MIPLNDAARQIRRANIVMISAISVTKNGGALVESGGLMMATAAFAYNVPVIILHQGYCLSDTLVLNQKSLLNM